MNNLTEQQHTLNGNQGEPLNIIRNGTTLICPFRTPVPMQDKNNLTGETRIVNSQSVCNSQCPHFNIDNDIPIENTLTVKLSCGSSNIIVIDKVKILPKLKRS